MVVFALTFLSGVGVGFLMFRGEKHVTYEDKAERTKTFLKGTLIRPPVPGPSPESRRTTPEAAALATVTGDGVITGRIRTRRRAPLNGVTVVATPVSDDPVVAVPATRSGNDGSYLLEGLVEGRYKVEAQRVGYRLDPVDARSAAAAPPGAIIDFRADALLNVPVEVIGLDGQMVPTARIGWIELDYRGRRPVDLLWTREIGSIELPSGHHEIRAFDSLDTAVASQPARVWVVQARETELIQFVLERRLGIRGRVFADASEEPQDVQVHLVRWDGTDPPTRKQMIAGGQHREARRGNGYAYAFEDLDPGRFWLAATRFSDRAEVEEFVELEAEPLEIDLQLPVLDGADHVIVRVVGPDAELLTDVLLGQRCSAAGSSTILGASAFLREDGSFAFLPDLARSPCEARDASHFIEVLSTVYGRREVEYDPRSQETVVVEFDDLAWLTVRLEGADTPTEESLLSMHIESIEPSASRHSESIRRADGAFEFEPVEPGRYKIVVMLLSHVSWGGSSGSDLLSHPIELTAGENLEYLTVPRFLDLTVVVPSAREGTRIDLRQRSPGSLQINNRPVDADDQVFFEAISEGRYTLMTNAGYAEGEMELELTDDTVVRFEPRPYTVFRVHIVDAEAALAKQGFLHQDIIIAIDGKELSPGKEALEKRLRNLEDRDGLVTCEILRGEEALRLQVEASTLTSQFHSGGWLAPATR